MILSLDSYFVFDGLLHIIFFSLSLSFLFFTYYPLLLLFIQILLGRSLKVFFFAENWNQQQRELSLFLYSSYYTLCDCVILKLQKKIAFVCFVFALANVSRCEMLQIFFMYLLYTFFSAAFFPMETYTRAVVTEKRKGSEWVA